MQGRNGDRDIENGLVDTAGPGGTGGQEEHQHIHTVTDRAVTGRRRRYDAGSPVGAL